MNKILKIIMTFVIAFVAFYCINHEDAQAAKSLPYSTMKKYQPSSKKWSFVYQNTSNGTKTKATLKYRKAIDGWVSNNSKLPDLSYNVNRAGFLVGAPSSDWIYTGFKVPTKKGKVLKVTDFDGNIVNNSKIISIQKTVKLKGGTYKNCVVVKERATDVTYYFAKNIGLILLKSDIGRMELVKVNK
ncbi:hypothetical protein MHH85_16915 [Viridibacillus sp. FSL E2-0187]|uniref:hypothetical protein n=1 Tax=Viridibacillus sp. FSL E2-0187 TaxID=2921362 RepID=UPI0030F6E951